MQSVTSNAVADCFSYHTTPKKIGKWINEETDVYRILCYFTLEANQADGAIYTYQDILKNKIIVKISGVHQPIISSSNSFFFPISAEWDSSSNWRLPILIESATGGINYQRGVNIAYRTNVYVEIDYLD